MRQTPSRQVEISQLLTAHPEMSDVKIAALAGANEKTVRKWRHRLEAQATQAPTPTITHNVTKDSPPPAPATSNAPDLAKVKALLRKHAYTLEELAATLKVSRGTALDAIDELKGEGANVVEEDGGYAIPEEPEPETFAQADDPLVMSLKQDLRRTMQQLDAAKTKTADLIEAVYQAATTAMHALHIPPVPRLEIDNRAREGEVAISVLADWQLGKVTPTYNTQVCEERIELLADKVIKLTNIMRSDHPVREVRVYLLGDLIEGELIFPGQSWRVDSSLFSQVLVDGPRILGGYLRRLASVFDTVRVVGVVGNHGNIGGRSWKEYNPESNADSLLYEVTKQLLESEPRIIWAPNMVKGERLWYQVDRIGEKSFMLFHGDQIRGASFGIPWYSYNKKIAGWRNGGIEEPFDFSFSGHWHQPVRMKIGRITHWGSGSVESTNTYASEYFSNMCSPSQWLIFSHLEHGPTAEFEVHLG